MRWCSPMAETNPVPPPTPRSGSPLWMRGLLVVSLAVNLLVFGMIGGAVLSGGGPGAAREAVRDLDGTPFVRALSPQDRRALLRELRGEREVLRDSRAALRDRFENLLAALRADDFDAASLERILAGQREAATARQLLGERLVLGRITEMSTEERRAYADRLEAEVRRPRPR